MNYDVLLVGDYFYDLIYTGLPRMPELGRELYAGGFDSVPGGPYNYALALHRLGVRVGWAGDFGTDPFSQLVLEAARRDGLDTALFQYHDRPYRRVTVAASFPEDRAFITYTDPPPKVSASLKALPRVRARALVIPGLFFGPVFDSAHLIVRARKMKIVMDCHLTDVTLADSAVQRAVRHVDVFLPNAKEACVLTGRDDKLEALRALGEYCKLVVMKDGANGAYALRAGEIIHVPAIAVQVVDTTGAGDCFGAGFVRAWLDGRPLPECLRWGTICGGLSATARGGTAAAPTLSEVEAKLKALGEQAQP